MSIDITPTSNEETPPIDPLSRISSLQAQQYAFTREAMQRCAAAYVKELAGLDRKEMFYHAGLLLDFIETLTGNNPQCPAK